MLKIINVFCPLCNSDSVHSFSEFREIEYFRCKVCFLIFMDRNKLLPFETERERYSLHMYDDKYDEYTSEIADKIIPHINRRNCGLDYGCGQFNVLSGILTKKGFPTTGYDPFYEKYNNPNLLNLQYDFVTAIETVEHFHYPQKTFTLISKILGNTGKFFIRTQIYENSINFENWWYIKDDTHVSFYSDHTIEFIIENFGLNVIII